MIVLPVFVFFWTLTTSLSFKNLYPGAVVHILIKKPRFEFSLLKIFVCKIPLLARRTRLSAACDEYRVSCIQGYLVYNN